ncbi:hypothetical protein OSTOST_04123 [Ostertagia ostertagi]
MCRKRTTCYHPPEDDVPVEDRTRSIEKNKEDVAERLHPLQRRSERGETEVEAEVYRDLGRGKAAHVRGRGLENTENRVRKRELVGKSEGKREKEEKSAKKSSSKESKSIDERSRSDRSTRRNGKRSASHSRERSSQKSSKAKGEKRRREESPSDVNKEDKKRKTKNIDSDNNNASKASTAVSEVVIPSAAAVETTQTPKNVESSSATTAPSKTDKMNSLLNRMKKRLSIQSLHIK